MERRRKDKERLKEKYTIKIKEREENKGNKERNKQD